MSKRISDHDGLFSITRERVLAALPATLALYLFGSFARGDAWPDSDVDLAVLLPPGMTIPDHLSLRSDLALATGREIDLVDLRRAGDVLRREVLASGRKLFEADPDTVLRWEAEAMTRYAEYRWEVKDLLADFHRTGVGYAGRAADEDGGLQECRGSPVPRTRSRDPRGSDRS